jgi:hypothetical protein
MTVLDKHFGVVGEEMTGFDHAEDQVVVFPTGRRSPGAECVVEATKSESNIPP